MYEALQYLMLLPTGKSKKHQKHTTAKELTHLCIVYQSLQRLIHVLHHRHLAEARFQQRIHQELLLQW
jgi:hypothetical protein